MNPPMSVRIPTMAAIPGPNNAPAAAMGMDEKRISIRFVIGILKNPAMMPIAVSSAAAVKTFVLRKLDIKNLLCVQRNLIPHLEVKFRMQQRDAVVESQAKLPFVPVSTPCTRGTVEALIVLINAPKPTLRLHVYVSAIKHRRLPPIIDVSNGNIN